MRIFGRDQTKTLKLNATFSNHKHKTEILNRLTFVGTLKKIQMNVNNVLKSFYILFLEILTNIDFTVLLRKSKIIFQY